MYSGYDITVIIPVYNSSKTLQKALDSVYFQTVRPNKILIINDGSTDNSEEICINWKNQHTDIELELYNIQNGGASNARNVGIRKTSSSLIAFLDADDSWTFDKIAKQISVLNDKTAKLCNLICTGSNLRSVDNKIHAVSKNKLLVRNIVVTSSVLVRSEIIKKYYFDTTLKRSEDYNLWLKIAVNDKGIVIINSPLVNYSFDYSPDKLSRNQKEFQMDELKNLSSLYKAKYLNFFEYLFAIFFSEFKYIIRCLVKYHFKKLKD